MPPVRTSFNKCKVTFSWQKSSNPAIQNYEVRVEGHNGEMHTLQMCGIGAAVNKCEVSMKELAMEPFGLGPG